MAGSGQIQHQRLARRLEAGLSGSQRHQFQAFRHILADPKGFGRLVIHRNQCASLAGARGDNAQQFVLRTFSSRGLRRGTRITQGLDHRQCGLAL